MSLFLFHCLPLFFYTPGALYQCLGHFTKSCTLQSGTGFIYSVCFSVLFLTNKSEFLKMGYTRTVATNGSDTWTVASHILVLILDGQSGSTPSSAGILSTRCKEGSRIGIGLNFQTTVARSTWSMILAACGLGEDPHLCSRC